MTAAAGPPRLVVSVTEIRRHPGTHVEVHRRLEADGLKLLDVSVPDGAEIDFDGDLESIHDGVVLTGTAEVPWVGGCRRCLRDVAGVATIDVREVYETRPVEGETWPLAGDEVDLGPLLHDIALLALPLAPLCDPDCGGPAPEEFPARFAGEEPPDDGDGDGAVRDPRWAALDDLDL